MLLKASPSVAVFDHFFELWPQIQCTVYPLDPETPQVLFLVAACFGSSKVQRLVQTFSPTLIDSFIACHARILHGWMYVQVAVKSTEG